MDDPTRRFRRISAGLLVALLLGGGAVVGERPVVADSVDDARRQVNEMADQLEAA